MENIKSFKSEKCHLSLDKMMWPDPDDPAVKTALYIISGNVAGDSVTEEFESLEQAIEHFDYLVDTFCRE